jgi:hypothetical protein
MNLKALSDILSEKNREYEIAHSRLLRALNLDQDDTTVKSYITLVKNDVAEWIRLTPMNNTKPKTAMLYLLEKCEGVREELGADESDEVAASIRAEWKKLSKEYKGSVAAKRSSSDTNHRSADEDDGASSARGGGDSDALLSDRDAYIASLETRLKLLQGIIEDIVKPGLSDAEKLQAVVMRALFFTELESSSEDE